LAALKRFSVADYTFRDIFDGNLVLSADYQYSSGRSHAFRVVRISLVRLTLRRTAPNLLDDAAPTTWSEMR
jgi:hypothetical protein